MFLQRLMGLGYSFVLHRKVRRDAPYVLDAYHCV